MRRAAKLVLPTLVAAEVLHVWSGIMDLREAVLVVVRVETLLLVVGVGNLLLIVRRYRRGRREGLDAWAALEDGITLVLPRMVAWLAANEPRLLVALFRWAFRRVGLADNEFGYHKRSMLREIMPLLMVAAPMELVVVHLLAHALSPWEWLKWAILVLEIYAILWMLGLYASLVTLPHRLEEKGLRLRYGAFAGGFIPYEGIQDMARVVRKAPNSGDGLEYAPEEDALYLAAGGKTDITLHLQTPRTIIGFLNESAPARILHLAADDPGRLARELRRRMEEGATGGTPVR